MIEHGADVDRSEEWDALRERHLRPSEHGRPRRPAACTISHSCRVTWSGPSASIRACSNSR